MRLFVAIDIDEKIRSECTKIMKSLIESGADLKTVRPENLHITLKFLGEVREDYVNKISASLSEFAGEYEPFSLSFSVLGYFGGVRFPRIIWVGISKGRDIVSDMASRLNRQLSFIRDEDKKPRPHMTLARVRTPVRSHELVETIQLLRDVKLSEIYVKEIKLKRSILKSDGPVYTDLKTFMLGNPAGKG